MPWYTYILIGMSRRQEIVVDEENHEWFKTLHHLSCRVVEKARKIEVFLSSFSLKEITDCNPNSESPIQIIPTESVKNIIKQRNQ